jgi:plasmid maintenance system killer protein
LDILFATERLGKECNDSRAIQRLYGKQGAQLLRRRLDDLRAASHLGIMRNLSGHCHELKGNRSGQLALDLHGGYRLIFEPANVPVPAKPDGGLEWERVTIIRILGVEDYHG